MQTKCLGLFLSIALLFTASILSPGPLCAEMELPAGFRAEKLPGTFTQPVAFAFGPDNTIFVAEKPGYVRVIKDDSVQSVRFIDLFNEVNRASESGLTGLALHPGFVPDGGPTSWVYLFYTTTPVPGENFWAYNQDEKFGFGRVARWKAITVNGNIVADPDSRHVLMGNQDPDGVVRDSMGNISTLHTSGHLLFAPDGSLLISNGDAAHAHIADTGGNEPAAFETFTHPDTGLKGPMPAYEDSGAFRSQDIRSLSGKILRINPETGEGYPSNPFYDGDTSSKTSRIWTLGLRNPFRFSIVPGTGSSDPSVGDPGVLFIGNVGWVRWETINVSFGGENFQWPCYEGIGDIAQFSGQRYIDFVRGDDPLDRPDCANMGPGEFDWPILSYNRWDGSQPPNIYKDYDDNPIPGFAGRAIIGGVHYAEGNYPDHYHGAYFFADYPDGWIKVLETTDQYEPTAVRPFADGVGAVVHLKTHPENGDIYYCTIAPGELWRISYVPNVPPVAVALAEPSFGLAPLTVQFDGSQSHDPDSEEPLIYEWDFGDSSPVSSEVSPEHTYTEDGVYLARLTVTDVEGDYASATVTIVVGDTPPTATILSPSFGSSYPVGTEVNLEGLGEDVQDPEESLLYTWDVTLWQDGELSPEYESLEGRETAFQIPGLPGGAYAFKITLSVTDTAGLAGQDHIWIYPAHHIHDVTVASTPFARISGPNQPGPTGEGMNNPLLFRDGDMPPVGTSDPTRQYDSFHTGETFFDQWAGLELTFDVPESSPFVGLVFQEGMHFARGGWFEEFTVEVLADGNWQEVNSLHIMPAYPFELIYQPYFNNVDFETYQLRFDPAEGDGIRLRGRPGGTHTFFSVAELRALMLTSQPPATSGITSGSARKLSDGRYVNITGHNVVTLSPDPPEGFFYAQAVDGSSGLRIEPTTSIPEKDSLVILSGKMDSLDTGERVLKYAMVNVVGSGNASPWKVTGRDVGGSGYIGTWGEPVTGGLTTEGLLVKVFGRVAHIGPANEFYVDDGSGVFAGPGLVGIKVINADQVPSIGSFVTVTGVSTAEKVSEAKIRVIRPRSGIVPSDIQIIIP